MPGVLSGSEDNDGVGWPRLIDPRCVHDKKRDGKQVGSASADYKREKPTVGMRLKNVRPRGDYSWPSNSTICSEGMAPCRSRRHEPSPLVRSTMVEGMSRGDWPPSTIRGRQSPNWSRTSCAFVHSTAPCRLAEVAVIGDPTARTMASGTSAAGTR